MSLGICHLPSVIRHSPFAIWHLAFVIQQLSFGISRAADDPLLSRYRFVKIENDAGRYRVGGELDPVKPWSECGFALLEPF